jgi:hypothetical protein
MRSRIGEGPTDQPGPTIGIVLGRVSRPETARDARTSVKTLRLPAGHVNGKIQVAWAIKKAGGYSLLPNCEHRGLYHQQPNPAGDSSARYPQKQLANRACGTSER